MLNELDLLSENISRLLSSLETGRHSLAEREGQLARVRVERDEALTTNRALRAERDALREERDALLAKIEDAQIKLNAILEKLPQPRLPAVALSDESDAPSEEAHADDASAHADHHAQHAEGETYER